MSGRRLGPGDAPESIGSILRRVFPTLLAPISDAAPAPPRERTPAIVFCSGCGSSAVDVVRWASPSVPVLRCAGCGHEAHVPGFTVGRFYGDGAAEVLRSARVDAAVYRGSRGVEATEG
ncbi:hypothetical protein WME98_50090 [Sorangium sp. So ce296]|uniref:hypothetical protein n=1 Tax=Sorangium sp. So ce296 TaxID=3133296 RepID=UPI003F6277D7